MTALSRFTWKRIFSAALLLVAAATLPGCFPVLVVGGATAAYVAADRRPADVVLGDERVGITASRRVGDLVGDRAHVNVTSFNYTVLITGEAPNTALKAEIEKVVGEIPQVKAVINEIQIAGISSIASRSNDSYLTSKIKSNFVAAVKFAPNHVKVVTEDGTVYLLGVVTHEEADAATEIARSTTGVQKVVRMFEYLGPAEQK